MKMLEFKELVDMVANQYGDIEVCMDIKDEEAVFALSQVLVEVEATENGYERRVLLCHGGYIFDKPYLTVVK